ncbi:MAG: type II toxin-antitoxin system mRNA interferase toxin, RelE/StbE family [Patescibacteria group bacterium]
MSVRKAININYSRKFLKKMSKLPLQIIEQAKEKEKVFRFNQFDQSLRTHKLSGKDNGCWAFWINYSYRIKFICISQSEVLFLEVGLHNIYN